MAIKELVKDEAILSVPCESATVEDAEVAQDLVDTMQSIEDAACLHANQIGVMKSLFAYVDDQDKPHVMYNPVIKLGLAASKQVEGCFTRDEPSTVTRYDRVKVAFEELVDGKLVPRKRDFVGWQAQLVQHMVDHSKGKLV
jgi:peptide deformylase